MKNVKENLSKVTILLALGSGVISCGQQNVAAQRPNILLIVSDDEDRDRVGCYGGAVYTPHINSIAESGVRFTNANEMKQLLAQKIKLYIPHRPFGEFNLCEDPIIFENAAHAIWHPALDKSDE